ncbi:MAG: GT4 family glycosyltransferase PelF [Formivibrio sp.]|nr:GT4 family glycosyltransferase PelF [Formivibrio sp.]
MSQYSPKIDVLLLLEGTFPFVSGGVSSWVNQIICGFPELKFGVIFLGSRRQDYGEMKYAIPSNVVHMETHYLHDTPAPPPIREHKGDPEVFKTVAAAHSYCQYSHTPGKMEDAYTAMLDQLIDGRLSLDTFLHSKESWDYTCEQYRARSTDPSFVDYFWTVRAMHVPIWMLKDIAANAPPARIYHTISTGYAGLLGTLLKRRTGQPLLLTEHGIYTKERKIDLFQSEWIKDNRNIFQRESTQISYFRHIWIRFFEVLGLSCYHSADYIVALYEINRQRQIHDGAPPDRTRNIPNGVDFDKLSLLREERPVATPKVLGLIGRVVPIKDIKTFIRAMRTVINQIPEAEAWIAGPDDEAPEYAEECRNLVTSLGLTDRVKFLGFQNIDELLPKIGLLVLSSISEALPLALLEGFAAGVPAISTDVGSCRQLIEGFGAEDQALGAAGRVVGVADPQALAAAAISLLDDETRWKSAQTAGIARVERYYTHEHMFSAYRALYQEALAQSRQQEAS